MTDEPARIRDLLPDAEEAMKWSMPAYLLNAKIILISAAFKAHLALNFWRGQELRGDAASTAAMGQFGRITSMTDLPPDAELDRLIREEFDVVQVDLFGGTELTDTDGEALTEKRAAAKWGVTVTPTLILMPPALPPGKDAARAAMAVLPGVLEAGDLLAVLEWARAGGPASGRDVRDVLSR